MIAIDRGRRSGEPPMFGVWPMTISIVAICESGSDDPKVIHCSDQQVSTVVGKAETALKFRFLKGGWAASVAGEGSAIKAAFRLITDGFLKAGVSGKGIDEGEALQIVRKALADRKRELSEEYTQGHYALSFDEFMASAKAKFPDEEFRRAMIEIRSIDLGAEFILCGYPNTFPFLIVTDRNGTTSTPDNFAVIGKGAALAQTVLLHRMCVEASPFDQVLYSVFEAKKYAERESSVGFSTSIFVQHRDESVDQVGPEGQIWLLEQFKQYGPQPTPKILEVPSNLVRKNYKF